MTRQQLFAAFFFAVFLFLISALCLVRRLSQTADVDGDPCANVLSNIRFFFEVARWPAFGGSARNDPVHYAAGHCPSIVPL